MAYYDALIAAWNTSTAAAVSNTVTGVAGVAGQSLNGLTTANKILAVNAWTVTGAVPTSFTVTGVQIANCVNYPEFKALTATQQANILALFQIPGQLLGGSANTAFLVDGMIIDYFPVAGPTITALTALAKATVTSFWATAGLTSPIWQADVTAAGLS